MRLRTRIGLLPASAGAVFFLSILVVLLAGNRTLASLRDHNHVLLPALAALGKVDVSHEQLRLTLENAALDADVDGRKAVEPIVAATDKVLLKLAAIPGESQRAAELRTTF